MYLLVSHSLVYRLTSFQTEARNFWAVLGVKQIKTTPFHHRTNELCESQHKTLTYELMIRSDIPSASEWCDLLTEMRSALISHHPSESNAAITPFEMVFGRKSRLSPVDICFPISTIPIPTPPQTSDQRKQHIVRLQQKLQGLLFKALEHSIEHKEALRIAHDAKRTASNSELQHSVLKPGDIVCVYTPSPRLKKLTYQCVEWSRLCRGLY